MKTQMKAAAGKVPLWLWIAGPLLVAGFFTWEWWHSSREVDTTNAYVKAERVMVSAQVPGRVVEVAVGQNQAVKKGELLFRLDPEPLRIALEQAQARLALVGNDADASRAQVRVAGSSIDSAEETVRWAERDLARVQDLAARQLLPRKNLDDARHALVEARTQRDAARAAQAEAAAALGGDAAAPVNALPEYRAALAAVDKARFDLQQASVYAPVAGVVGGHDLQAGEYLNAGQVAMPLVAADPVWVEANFKETDMAKLRIGQGAKITVDGYPGETWAARVASISPGSGSEFSVLPAQNASGNWVKIVQRIPVRLELLPGQSHPQVLRAGMSAEVTVDLAHALLPPRATAALVR